MTDHHHHHHARLNRLQTTSQLLRQTTNYFSSHPLTFLFLTSLLFSFHSLVDHCSLLLTYFVDTDPSLRSLLSRLPLSSHSHAPHPRVNHHRRAPFLQLTRLGTLDDDFFSTDEHDPHRGSLQGSSFPSPINATTVILSGFDTISGFFRPIADNGLLLPQIIRSGFVLRQMSSAEEDENMKFDESEEDRETENEKKGSVAEVEASSDVDAEEEASTFYSQPPEKSEGSVAEVEAWSKAETSISQSVKQEMVTMKTLSQEIGTYLRMYHEFRNLILEQIDIDDVCVEEKERHKKNVEHVQSCVVNSVKEVMTDAKNGGILRHS